jgi:DNA-binding MarR family transcriptional regulator
MTDPTRTLVERNNTLTEGIIIFPQHDLVARQALKTYIEATNDDAVANGLQAWLDRCLDDDRCTDGGIDIAEVAASRRDVLATIAKLYEGRPLKGTEIAAHAGIDNAHIYHILNVLEDKQLIDRQTDPCDDRVSRTKLTDTGVAVLQQLQNQHAELDLPTEQIERSTDEPDDIRTDGGNKKNSGMYLSQKSPANFAVSMHVDTASIITSTDRETTTHLKSGHVRMLSNNQWKSNTEP